MTVCSAFTQSSFGSHDDRPTPNREHCGEQQSRILDPRVKAHESVDKTVDNNESNVLVMKVALNAMEMTIRGDLMRYNSHIIALVVIDVLIYVVMPLFDGGTIVRHFTRHRGREASIKMYPSPNEG
jgi:hypothetical protein